MIDKIQKNCTGCSACLNACPKNAIEISYRNSFFYEPIVDYDKCVSCKKCISICPALEYKSGNANNPTFYAVYASDEMRNGSTSGAVFPIIAEYILENGGYVCGAAWTDTWDVSHIIVDNKQDLQKLRVSKYVQSYVGNVFDNIKKLLNNGKIVLFSGTPCQNAGLCKYLSKEYDNLYTIDLLCHGIPSPLIWQDYLEAYFNKQNIESIVFRSKTEGWNACKSYVYNPNRAYVNDGKKNPIGCYYEAFLTNRISNESCMECNYKFIPRPGDFTLGDFWHYPFFDKNLNDGKGLSAVLLNNKKADRLFEIIKPRFKYVQKINLKKRWEHIEVTNLSKANAERTLLFSNYSKYGVRKSLEAACCRHFDVALLTFFNGLNYGSGLVAYAQNKILEKLGYTVLNIHKPYNGDHPYTDENQNWRFAKKHYYISRFFEREESCRELNAVVDAFIVGSDTTWWWSDVNRTGFHYWLDFAEADKKKLSFCTSFANSYSDIPNPEQAKARYLYSRFDALSVREKDGQKILKDTFGVDSECFIDPTFIVDKEVWDELAKQSSLNEEKYLLAYILDYSREKEEFIKGVAIKLNLKIVLISHPSHKLESTLFTKKIYDLEDFVCLYKNASFVITDSFHGTCFSVIYEKEFLSIINTSRGGSRYDLFRTMNLGHRLLSTLDVDDSLLVTKTDYSFSKPIIKENQTSAIQWLDGQLRKTKTEPTETELLYDYLKSEIEKNVQKTNVSNRLTRYYKRFYKFASKHKGFVKRIYKLYQKIRGL